MHQFDFWKFFVGQGLAALGSSFTSFALPLLIFQLTESPTSLALSFAFGLLPYLLFGLVGGAWADRTDRKRLMIRTDLLRGMFIVSIPVLYYIDSLPIWWIYATGFAVTALRIPFESAQFAAIPSLVPSGELVKANGRITASFTATSLIGPILAGLIAGFVPVVNVLFFDALTFVVSALTLMWVRTSFNTEAQRERRSMRADIQEGLGYVWDHPVLRSISIMMALVNFVTAVTLVELVFFAKEHLEATNFQYGLLVSGGGLGVIIFSLAAGWLRERFSFGTVALGTQVVYGLLIIAFALSPSYWTALPAWSILSGLAVLFNININSLRQTIVPNHLLGRVMSVARVLAWSAAPLGALVGAYLVEQTNVVLVYATSGTLATLIPIAFFFSPLGHAEDYLRVDSPVETGPAAT